jgi:ABC-type branched-subunit amino acid transport system substrate-binding protein
MPRFCLTLACALLLALPATLPSVAIASQQLTANDDFERGRELFFARDLPHALAVLRAFVQRYPEHPQIPAAYSLIGRILASQGRFHDALLYLQRLPEFLRGSETELLTGYCLVQIGDFERGQEKLLPLVDHPFDQEDRERLLLALAEAKERLGQPLQALVFYQQALPLAGEPARLLGKVHLLLQSRLSESALEEAAFMWRETMIGQDARLQLARRALGQEQQERAKQLLQQILAAPVTFPYWQEAEMLLQRASVESWFNRDSIGVLLPLSGRFASYGELVKRGLELALQEHNKTRLPVQFIYRDTADVMLSPSQQVSRLADDDKVMAIIGPLLGAGAEEAGRRAELEMVPLLTLSQREGLPQLGNFVFRDSLTPQLQIQKLVGYAMESGHISFSVLRPENRLGEQMTELFVAEVRRLGGEIVDIVSYPEEATDFRSQVRELLWERPDQEQAVPAEDSPAKLEYPLPPFHALFIPDYAERISLLAPQLMFYGIKDVTLLGINGWNAPELASQAGRFLERAVFVDSYFPNSKLPEIRRFIELYRLAYKDEPSVLEAQAFDAANLVLQVMDDPTVRNRDDLRQKLSLLRNFRGVTGTTGFDQYGEARKELFLLRIRRGRIVDLL